MHQERENLDILFRRTAPETVLENIRSYGQIIKKCPINVDAADYTKKAYEHYSSLNFPEYSPDEIEIRFQYLKNSIERDHNMLLFRPICEYADKVLVMKKDVPVCRLDYILGWNSISKRLGQDLFTAAWLAMWDLENNITYKRSFSWPAIIRTDDRRLNEIFQRGLAENHFHLHGSTQSFGISWTCLMNHPEYLGKYFSKKSAFPVNLNASVSKGISDNQMNWITKMEYAVMIRALLFARCAGLMDSKAVWEKFIKFDRMPSLSKMKQQTEPLRRIYGQCFKQKDGRKKCLDYAVSSSFYYVEEDSPNRLLAGERSFLYHCFRRQFESDFTRQEASLLYLYILIKSQFRSELIQVNKRKGFTNFAWYQDRKNQFFGDRNEYWTEAQRLSVGAVMAEGHMVSLEVRIMPKDTAVQLKSEIGRLEGEFKLALGENANMPYYVVHFPKKKFVENEFKQFKYLLRPRNWPTREMARKRAHALVKYLQLYDREGKYILGIDACSLEIGCRPEVFATEFRYVRKYGNRRRICWWNDLIKDQCKEIGFTYHVGEDFLDIIDGLRAIDEAVIFLDMQKGDRLGHALALGIEPEEFYQKKNKEIYLTAQDYLDNLIWILYRSLEFNIQIDANRRAEMMETARQILMEIYDTDNSQANGHMIKRQSAEMLNMYYAGWKLRGDHPDLYRSGVFQEIHTLAEEEYESCMKTGDDMDHYRKNEVISELYYLYHFDAQSKRQGLEPVFFAVKEWYVDLARQFQAVLRMKIAERGIAIECNPTSNVLIGTFEFYDKHPILTFNHYYLKELSRDSHIQVSVNTDDLGVFDTSLENEYAVLLCAICRARHREGNYNDDAVYDYIDYLRMNGIRMAFRK